MKRDAFWSGLEAAVAAIFSVATSFAIARLVGPSELGIGAAATSVHVLLWVAVNALFADALVQRPHVNDRILSSAFWAALCAGCLGMMTEAASGIALTTLFGDPRLLPMAAALAVTLPFVGAGSAVQGLLTRERAYRQLALRTIVGQGLGAIVGIGAALSGAGAWALIYQQAAGSLAGALMLLAGRGWTPARCCDLAIVRSLLGVGLPLTASTLVLIARYRVFAVILGGSAGPAVLGQVHIAFRLVDAVRELLFTALWRLMLPEFSDVQHDRTALLALTDRWVRRCAAVTLPLCLVPGVTIGHAVIPLMGARWAEAGGATAPLLALMAWSALNFPSGVALVALGQARFTLYANIAALSAAALGVWLMHPTSPWPAAIVWTTSQIAVTPYSLWVNARALGVGMLRPLTGGFRVPAIGS